MGRRARARRGPLQHRERKESNWRERGWAKILKLRSIQYSACKRYRWECKNDLRCSIANSHLVVRIICSEERVHRSWISSRFVLGAFGREYINSCATSGVHEINEWSINHGMDLSLKFCSKIYNKPLLANKKLRMSSTLTKIRIFEHFRVQFNYCLGSTNSNFNRTP